MLRKYEVLLFLICFHTNQAFGRNFIESSNIARIETQIEQGDLNQAEQKLLRLSKLKTSSKEQKYHVYKLLCKIYLSQQAFIKYNSCLEKSAKISKSLHEIYQAEAYAHKAYYYHYLMWGDSALHYSNKSMALLRKNRSYIRKIDPAFVYEVYAITYLYRQDNIKPTAYLNLPLSDAERKRYQYFDSAIYIEKRYPFQFLSDKAMLYRSYANRWLDKVSYYQVFNSQEAKKLRPIQWISFHQANRLYDSGLACLKSWHINDFIVLISLKGMNYTNVGKWAEAEELFAQVNKRYSREVLLNRDQVAYQTLMNFETFKIRNMLVLPYNKKKVDDEIRFLKKVIPEFWQSFFDVCELPYDPYRTSPYVNLFSLYTFKSLHEKNDTTSLKLATSYLLTMKSYFHFLQRGIYTNGKYSPFFDVQRIQKKLKKNECYLLSQNDTEFLKKQALLITQKKVVLIRASFDSWMDYNSLDTVSLSAFKKGSYKGYLSAFSTVKKILPNVEKVFVAYDDFRPYEILISDTTGERFEDLKYLGQKINFVRVYDSFRYFGKELFLPRSKIDARFLQQKDKSKLLFTNDFFKNFKPSRAYSNEKYRGNIKTLLSQKGIFHLYGHGELAINKSLNSKSFQLNYEINRSEKKVNKLRGGFAVNRDLVVLNNCFSGFPLFLFNEFNKTIPMQILSNGAKSLISSPYKVDDYFSAEFFKLFYAKIEQGYYYEDAFFEAKREFLIDHPELRHPAIWNGLQLIVNDKIKNEPIHRNYTIILLFLSVCLVDIFQSLRYVRAHKKQQMHPTS